MAATGKESSAVQERESAPDEAKEERKRADQVEQAEGMQGIQSQEAAQELPVSVQKQDAQGKRSQDTGKIAEATVEEGQDDKEKEKEDVVPEKAENGDTEHNEGQAEAEAEIKPQPKKRGRPKKDQTPKKSAEEAAASTPATPAEKPEASEETPKSKRGRKKRTDPELSPAVDRPSRERRSIDRYAASLESPSSRLYIRKGSGTPLKDIPNVAYRLSQISRNDQNLRLLHFVLFAHTPKDSTIKSNIMQFSGHAWGNKERDEQIVKQRLQRCDKKQLTELMKIFDLDIKGEQEDLCTQFMEFLQAPHATTDVIVEKEKSGSKLKGKSPGRPKKQNSDEPPKRRGRKRKQVDDESDESLEEEEEIEQKNTYKDTDEEEASASADTGKATEADSEDRQPRKKQKTDSKAFARKSNKKKASKNSAKVKSQTKTKSHTDKERSNQHDGGDEAQSAINHPKEEDIRPHVRELLNILDLKKASFNVVFKHLGTRLHVDFSEPSLRTRAKALIKEELLKPEVDKGSSADAQAAKNDEAQKEDEDSHRDKGSSADAQAAKNDEAQKEGEDTPMAEAHDQSETAGSERKYAPSEATTKDEAEAKDQATETKTNDAGEAGGDGKVESENKAAQDLNEKSQEAAAKPAEVQSEQAEAKSQQDEVMAEAKSQQDEESKSQQDEVMTEAK